MIIFGVFPALLEKLLPRLANVVVECVERSADGLVLRARARARLRRCPRCGTPSRRVHGRCRAQWLRGSDRVAGAPVQMSVRPVPGGDVRQTSGASDLSACPTHSAAAAGPHLDRGGARGPTGGPAGTPPPAYRPRRTLAALQDQRPLAIAQLRALLCSAGIRDDAD